MGLDGQERVEEFLALWFDEQCFVRGMSSSVLPSSDFLILLFPVTDKLNQGLQPFLQTKWTMDEIVQLFSRQRGKFTSFYLIPGHSLPPKLWILTHGFKKGCSTNIAVNLNKSVFLYIPTHWLALYSQQKQDPELTVAQIMNSLLPNSDWNWRK